MYPLRIKHFIWRCCRDCLPTRHRLQRQGIPVHCDCVMFETDFENSWHIFISHSYAQSCKRAVGIFVEIDRLAYAVEGL